MLSRHPHSKDWKYHVKELKHGAPLSLVGQYFGQLTLRKEPRFYLLTRFFVQCRNTGAMHSFRFKHDEGANFGVDQLNPQACFELQRTDTVGYLGWYLDYIFLRQGEPLSIVFDTAQTIKTFVNFTSDELLGQDSFILCTEVEQVLLATHQLDLLRKEADYACPLLPDRFEEEKKLIDDLCRGADAIPCFLDLMLRRLLVRVVLLATM